MVVEVMGAEGPQGGREMAAAMTAVRGGRLVRRGVQRDERQYYIFQKKKTCF